MHASSPTYQVQEKCIVCPLQEDLKSILTSYFEKAQDEEELVILKAAKGERSMRACPYIVVRFASALVPSRMSLHTA